MHIGERIRSYRTKRGITQAQLGEKLFVTKQAVSKWENGWNVPDLDMLTKLAQALEISAEMLLQDTQTDTRVLAVNSEYEKEASGMQSNIENWQDYKFGMFIHYGLYSVIGEGEWVMFNKPMDKDEYAETMKEFTAENFDGKRLASLAKQAGMKYMVMTTRHHDGFCLFDSKHSIGDYTVMRTPANRDLIREYADACRAEGLGVGFYYSPMDWRCEGFFFPKMYKKSALQMRTQCHEQVTELMENYGKIDVLWYDGGEDYWLAHGKNLNGQLSHGPGAQKDKAGDGVRNREPIVEEFWGEFELDKIVRDRQPQIVINNRLGMRRCGGYGTPERVIGEFNTKSPWETCDTLSETWGWMPNTNLRSVENVAHLLIQVITGGGNLLLNVSPRGDGSLEPEHEQRLIEIGQWTGKYADAIYGTRGGPMRNDPKEGGFVWKENKLFAYLMNPERESFKIPLCGAKVEKVRCLSGEAVSGTTMDDVLTVMLPKEKCDPVACVVEITLDGNVGDIYREFDPEMFDAFA